MALFVHKFQFAYLHSFQHFGNKLIARSVKCGIRDFQSVRKTDMLSENGFKIGFDNVVRNVFDKTGIDIMLQIFGFHFKRVHRFDIAGKFVCRVVGKLTTVASVHFITVVTGGVVRRGYHNAHIRFVIARDKRQKRRGHKLCGYVRFNSVFGKNFGNGSLEYVAVIAAVTTAASGFHSVMLHAVCDTLSNLSYCINVKAIGSCAQFAAQSACTELKILIKTIFDAFFIVFHCEKTFFYILVGNFFQPQFIIFSGSHIISPVLLLPKRNSRIFLTFPLQACLYTIFYKALLRGLSRNRTHPTSFPRRRIGRACHPPKAQ